MFRFSRSRSLLMALTAATLLTGMPAMAQETPVPIADADAALFDMRVLTTGLAEPWAMSWGPDGRIWLTERAAGRVSRVDPQTGESEVLLTLDDVLVGPQHEGLLGMALHPELMGGTGNDYVYLAYTYDGGNPTADRPVDRRAKLVRYSYDEASAALTEPMELISGIRAWDDHTGGRLIIGPDMKLYYTIGEMGGNQGRNYQRPIESQLLPTADQVAAEDWTAYNGKTLRLNLDGTIPEDNPELDGVRSHVFSYGHRNHQGIAFAEDGTLYSVEHGPSTDDELNILVPGGNYGWPNVAGLKDDSAYLYSDWSQSPEGMRFNSQQVPPEVPSYPETSFEPEMVDPLATYFTVGSDYDFTANCGWICNPTIGPSAVTIYEAGEDGIAEWDHSALIATLKHGSVYVQKLSADGQAAEGEPIRYFNSQNRYRDLLIGPDNKTVYIATDTTGTTHQLYGDVGFTNVLHNPGAILVFTYTGNVSEPVATPVSATEAAPEGEPAPAGAAPAASDDSAALDADLLTQGNTLFSRLCRSCHGASGAGAQGPALAGNQHLADTAFVADTLVHGFGYMPPFGSRLDDTEIAAIGSYIRNSWGNGFGPVSAEDIAAVR